MRIGVIGGNGVAATNRLCDLIERSVTESGACQDAQHPEMIVWQATSVPSRSMFLEGRGPDWRPDYIRIACQLKALGCDLGCMCCNTAHYAVDEISQASGLKFVNLLKEVVQKARSTGLTKFELFCSDGARKFDLYGYAFKRFFPEARILYPSAERQQMVTKVICGVKNRTRMLLPEDEMSPRYVLQRLLEKAQAPVIFGCTDLRVAYAPTETVDVRVVVDSLECLASALLRANERDA